jgi:hypothetical protein
MTLTSKTPKKSLKKGISNRKNAQNSSGPKTPLGKWRSSQNAVRHGMTSHPDEGDVLHHLRMILSDDSANVEDAITSELGSSAVKLAIAEARIDRLQRHYARPEELDRNKVEAEFLLSQLPYFCGRGSHNALMRMSIKFLAQQKFKSSKKFATKPSTIDRYLCNAHASRRKALLRLLSAMAPK